MPRSRCPPSGRLSQSELDDMAAWAIEGKVHVHDLHATMPHLLGFVSREHDSQTVFANYLNVTSSLVSKRERGEAAAASRLSVVQ